VWVFFFFVLFVCGEFVGGCGGGGVGGGGGGGGALMSMVTKGQMMEVKKGIQTIVEVKS